MNTKTQQQRVYSYHIDKNKRKCINIGLHLSDSLFATGNHHTVETVNKETTHKEAYQKQTGYKFITPS